MDLFRATIEIIKLLLDPFSRQIDYVRKFRKNLRDLQEKRDTLTSVEEDVSKEIERANLERKDPKNVVQNWLERVANVKEEISEIEKECEENEMCLKNCMPNYCLRRKVSKRSLELIGKLEVLKNESPFEGGVAVDLLPATTHTFSTAPLFGVKVIEDYIKQICKWLKDENIRKIGIHGMGGVGKTTIVTHINNHLKDSNLFDNIIWVTVSKDLNLKRLQSDIAKAINLDLPDDRDEKVRSGKLSEALLVKKKFVLILDDLWEAFSLDDIGIPEPNKENGAKMVLTTRLLQVCGRMETQKDIKVNALPEGYAWDLFSSKVAEDVLRIPGIENIAKDVAKECKGLPLALITVGLALRNDNDVRLWRNALNELRDSTHNIRGMEDDVFKRLTFSYTRLKDEAVRACFLYCSLYPEDHEINEDDLIKLWMWEGLINEDGGKRVAMDKGYFILNELICACMLEKVPYRRKVKMHDLVRDMAIGITRDNPRFMVKTGIGLKEQPKEEEFVEDIERISLSSNKIASLTGQPNCPKLETLFLCENKKLRSISPSFFLDMHSLKVLDLSFTGVVELPKSLSGLVKLCALLLHRCLRLVVLPSLAKLKELRILDLSWTAIRELPHGMEGLVNLRYLDLSHTTSLKAVRDGIIPQLSVLEELLLTESSWEFDMTNREGETIINEIFGLKRLDTLAINFKDQRSLSIYLESDHWRSYEGNYGFCFRSTEKRYDDAFCLYGYFKMKTDDTNHPSVLGFTESYFKIEQCWGNLVVPQVLLDYRGFKTYELGDCDCTEYICNGGEDPSLLNIDVLRVAFMGRLKAISKGVTPCGALANLKELYISGCDALQHVFTVSSLQSLQNLEVIDIQQCLKMEEIIAPSKGEHQGVLPSLRILRVFFCRGLKTLFSSDLLQCLQNIEQIEISSCDSKEQMFVEEADGEDISEVKNITRNAISLPSLRILTVKYCDGLKTLFSYDLLQSLQNIEEIDISSCDSMEQMFVEEADGEDTSEVKNITRNAISLPSLRVLRLLWLRSLKCISERMLICNSGQKIQLLDCPQLSSLPLSIENPTATLDGWIEGSRDWWNALDWEDPNTKTILEPLFS